MATLADEAEQSSRVSGAGLGAAVPALGLYLLLASLAAIGLIDVVARDFSFQWQAAPPQLPHRSWLAVITGILLLISCAIAGVRSGRGKRLWPLAIVLALWVLLLQLPAVARNAASFGSILGVAEIGSFTVAIWALALKHAGQRSASAMLARVYGAIPVFFGLSHFLYPALTTSLVPAWIPQPLFWAYATGALHMAGGLLIIGGVRAPWAAAGLGTMYLSWVLLLPRPRVIASPGSRIEWVMLCIAGAISGGAYLIAQLSEDRAAPRRM